MKQFLFLFFSAPLVLASCTHELEHTKYILPARYIGKMTIYFNKPNGKHEIDKDGWVIDRISDSGEYFTSSPMTPGWTIPHKTWKFYEVYSKDSMTEIPEFDENEYLKDPYHNRNRKYAIFRSSGFKSNNDGTNPNDLMVYDIDSGKNYKPY